MPLSYDRSRPTVIIMEDEQQTTRAYLIRFVKYAIITMSINFILGIVGYILLHHYIMSIVHACVTAGIGIFIVLDTIKQSNLGNVFRIANDASHVINETEVFDATRNVREARGYIKGMRRVVQYYHIFTAGGILALSIESLINFFTIGG